jgi:feruloyl esterase
MFSGSADPAVPFSGMLNYYGQIAETVGGIGKLMQHARCFLVPGQDHGVQITRYAPAVMNGDTEIKNAIDVICAWCERGIAPERFDMITEAAGVAVKKTIFAYGTKENPLP